MNEPPNLILVSIDSLRADHCGYLGDDRDLTPTLDRLAAEGIAYENAIVSGPQTFTSMPAVFTGHHRPAEVLEDYAGETHWQRRLAAVDHHIRTRSTLPERLQRLGYTTAAINPNPWTSTATGYHRGFDRFVDLSSEGTDGRVARFVHRLPSIDESDRAVQLVVSMLTNSSFFTRWTDVYRDVMAVREELSEPYFLWVFLLDTHFPFVSPRSQRVEGTLPGMYYSNYRGEKWMRGAISEGSMPAHVLRSLRRGYRDTVRGTDAFLERLVDDFAVDDPIIAVHSDHGESFGDHGNYGHHHRQPYEENIHVPYVIGNVDRSATVTEPTSLATIYDTMLGFARGQPVAPSRMAADFVLSQGEYGVNRAIRGERFKYLDLKDDHLLFDLEADPDETEDLSDERPVVLERLEQRLETFDTTIEEKCQVAQATDALVQEYTH